MESQMSDEATQTGTPSGLFLHYCEHAGCAAWGSYGYRSRRTEPVRYFCHDHRDDGELLLGRSHAS